MNRCTLGEQSDHPLQAFDRDTDGRVFTCAYCSMAVCADCDRPEHYGETCDQYRERVIQAPAHLKAEAANIIEFGTCPGCKVTYKLPQGKKGCGFVDCTACGFRFCDRVSVSFLWRFQSLKRIDFR